LNLVATNTRSPGQVV